MPGHEQQQVVVKKNLSTAVPATLAMLVLFVGVVRADSIEVDLSGLVNSNLTLYTGGGNYPQSGGPLTIAGIPFELATFGQDTGVIQSSGVETFDIPIDTIGVTTAYFLLNSADGSCGTTVGNITLVGSSYSVMYNLTEGSNIRDHYNGSFCNSAPDVAGTANFGPDRLDMQQITLPSDFSTQTLESIEFYSSGQGTGGQPFLAAATLETTGDPPDDPPVPEPSNIPIVCTGIAILVLGRQRLHRNRIR